MLELQKEEGLISKTDVLSQKIEINTDRMEILQQKISLASAAYTLAYVTGILE